MNGSAHHQSNKSVLAYNNLQASADQLFGHGGQQQQPHSNRSPNTGGAKQSNSKRGARLDKSDLEHLGKSGSQQKTKHGVSVNIVMDKRNERDLLDGGGKPGPKLATGSHHAHNTSIG